MKKSRLLKHFNQMFLEMQENIEFLEKEFAELKSKQNTEPQGTQSRAEKIRSGFRDLRYPCNKRQIWLCRPIIKEHEDTKTQRIRHHTSCIVKNGCISINSIKFLFASNNGDVLTGQKLIDVFSEIEGKVVDISYDICDNVIDNVNIYYNDKYVCGAIQN